MNQRSGMKACTPFGYFLHEVADGIGFIGFFLFIITPIFLLYQAIAHRFSWHLCWFLLLPIVVGIVGRVLFEISWWVAARKQFEYDCKTRTARWVEEEQPQAFPDAR